MNKKGLRKKRLVLCLFIVMALLVVVFSNVVLARAVVIQTNNVELVPGTKANNGEASFKDSVDTSFTLKTNIANGQLEQTGFTIHDQPKAGAVTVTLTAPDSNVPGYSGEKVTRNRIATESKAYTEMTLPILWPLDKTLNTINDTPPPVTGTATQTGFNLEIKPVISVSLSLLSTAPYTGNYAPSKYPFSGYFVRVLKGSQVIEEKTSSGGSIQLAPEKYESTTEYTVRAYAYNNLTKGHGGTYDPKWSGDIKFTTVAGPSIPGTGPIKFIRNLYQYDSSKLVVNMIASPKATKASDLVALIESKAGAGSVIAVSKSLPQVGSSVAYIPGQPKISEDFAIEAGEGVQVFVKKGTTVELSN